MAISVIAVHRNQSVPGSLAVGGARILSGVVECVFKGDASGGVSRDTLSFTIGRVNFPGIITPASFGCDGAVSDALWAVDGADVGTYVNVDSGSGTADLQVFGNLAVRGPNGMVLRQLHRFPCGDLSRRGEKRQSGSGLPQ